MYGADRGRIAGGRRPVRGDEDEKQQGEGERGAHGVPPRFTRPVRSGSHGSAGETRAAGDSNSPV